MGVSSTKSRSLGYIGEAGARARMRGIILTGFDLLNIDAMNNHRNTYCSSFSR